VNFISSIAAKTSLHCLNKPDRENLNLAGELPLLGFLNSPRIQTKCGVCNQLNRTKHRTSLRTICESVSWDETDLQPVDLMSAQ
jgi:hypothetical protein